METNIVEKFRLQYLLLVKEFLFEVEKGTEWQELKPMIQEMKTLDHYIRSFDKQPFTSKLVA